VGRVDAETIVTEVQHDFRFLFGLEPVDPAVRSIVAIANQSYIARGINGMTGALMTIGVNTKVNIPFVVNLLIL